jgi:hypothetical protein
MTMAAKRDVRQRLVEWSTPPRVVAILTIIVGLMGIFEGPIPYLPIPGLREFHIAISPELIGMGITVLLIDTANEYRDKKRWERVTNLVYSRLLIVVEQFLSNFSLGTLLPNPYVYRYGDATITVYTDYSNVSYIQIEERIRHMVSVSKTLSETIDQTVIQKSVDALANEIASTLNTSLTFLDAELVSLLLSFQRSIYILQLADLEKDDYDNFAQLSPGTIRKAIAIARYLIDETDGRMTLDEYFNSKYGKYSVQE